MAKERLNKSTLSFDSWLDRIKANCDKPKNAVLDMNTMIYLKKRYASGCDVKDIFI